MRDHKTEDEMLEESSTDPIVKLRHCTGCTFDLVFAMAELGAVQAQRILGDRYTTGNGVPHQSSKLSAKWYQKAALQGDIFPQLALGGMYLAGKGVRQSDKLAAKWTKKAAEQGHPKAQMHIGSMYLFGKGVRESHESTAKWFRKAAEQGHAPGQYGLASLYERGAGVPRDMTKALAWAQKAAAQGHNDAVVDLHNGRFGGQAPRTKGTPMAYQDL
jgi:TPR repeat protein